MSTPTSSYNVRELLDLERNIYQESIDRQLQQYQALVRGEHPEYILKCKPFSRDREREMETARSRFELNMQNARDLLEYDRKAAQDEYSANVVDLKNRLLKEAKQRKRQLQGQLEKLQAIRNISFETNDMDTQCKIEPVIDDKKLRQGENDASKYHIKEPVILDHEGTVDQAALTIALDEVRTAGLATFNLRHIEDNIPAADQLVNDLMAEIHHVEVRQAKRKRFADKALIQLTITESEVIANVNQKFIDLLEPAHPYRYQSSIVFQVNDEVTVWSEFSNESFYGHIASFPTLTRDENGADMISGSFTIRLICNSELLVAVAKLYSGECTITHTPKTGPLRLDRNLYSQNSSHSSLSPSLSMWTPHSGKRSRRKTTGLRQKL